MPYRIPRYARPSKASHTPASLIKDGSGSSFGFRFDVGVGVGGKARSSLRRKIFSFCRFMRSGNRKRLFARTESGSGFEFTGRLPRCVDDVEIASYQGHAALSFGAAR